MTPEQLIATASFEQGLLVALVSIITLVSGSVVILARLNAASQRRADELQRIRLEMDDRNDKRTDERQRIAVEQFGKLDASVAKLTDVLGRQSSTFQDIADRGAEQSRLMSTMLSEIRQDRDKSASERRAYFDDMLSAVKSLQSVIAAVAISETDLKERVTALQVVLNALPATLDRLVSQHSDRILSSVQTDHYNIASNVSAVAELVTDLLSALRSKVDFSKEAIRGVIDQQVTNELRLLSETLNGYVLAQRSEKSPILSAHAENIARVTNEPDKDEQ